MARKVDSIEVLERAGVGFKLSLLLSAVSCEVFNGGVETHSIAKGISVLAVSLKHAGRILQEPDPIYSAQAANVIREISHQSAAVFDELKSMLSKAQTCDNTASNTETLRDHFLRCFKKHRVTYLIAYMESLNLSLMAIEQIITLGKLLASKRYMEQSLATALIEQERAEIQNVLIIRCWSLNRLDRLYDLARQEAEEGSVSSTYNPALDPSMPKSQRNAFRKLRAISFGDVDTTLKQIKKTPRDMVKVSAEAIDPLLQLWVRRKQVSGVTEGSEQPQRARIFADDLRQRYAKYWATVQTDSEESETECDEATPNNVSDPSSSSSYNSQHGTASTTNGLHNYYNIQRSNNHTAAYASPDFTTGDLGNARSQTYTRQGTRTSPFDNRDTYKIPVHDLEGASPNALSSTDTWKIPCTATQLPDQHAGRPNCPPPTTSYTYANASPNYPIHPPHRSYSHPPGPYLRQHVSSHYPQHPQSGITPHPTTSTHDCRTYRRRRRVSFIEDQYSDLSSSEEEGRNRLRRNRRVTRRERKSNDRTKGYRRSTLHGVLGTGAITAFLKALEGFSPGNWPLFMKY
ncbi:uncharacterized protein MCYG_05853 [Microsporum canis CBS 113480]|uniref:Fungal N-terminal domain-containing protein n=1 Tax=Arthroderma otae (strain ATCC MYA-4605 / CBS 113480) TaxID=554155 RepID=C5FT31_ARTOC|nr:uncharacterized protein MCYG_05853 [Microsporum canis CBS 113480]EEQ33034.1 predicted protein [Microsporum canis CBS 113480]